MDERWDLYDINRNATGEMHQRGTPLPKDRYHQQVYGWVANGKGQVLLTLRHPQKRHGGLWECTGGAALAGENSWQAVKRELKKEIGLDVSAEDGGLIRSIRVDYPEGCGAWVDIYLFTRDVSLESLVLQPTEVVDARWATREDYLRLKQDKLLLDKGLPDVLEMYLL